MNPTIPGYYVVIMGAKTEWPYITSQVVSGPHPEKPVTTKEVEKVRYWDGTTWKRIAA